MKDLPDLAKGKGNKMLSIPGARVLSREEFLVDIAILQPEQNLVIMAGSKKLAMKPKDWQHYVGERGRRGNKLPRGFQKLDKLVASS